jgi:hypothetical protein
MNGFEAQQALILNFYSCQFSRGLFAGFFNKKTQKDTIKILWVLNILQVI